MEGQDNHRMFIVTGHTGLLNCAVLKGCKKFQLGTGETDTPIDISICRAASAQY